MKIGIVCPYNMFKAGGVQECVLELRDELANRGHEVRIITPAPRKTLLDTQKDMIFIGTGADIKTPFHTTAQVSVGVKNEVIDKILEKEAFDILHFHEPWISVVSRQILIRSKAKNIATFHAKLPETMMSRTLERVATPYMKSILKYLDALTAVSEPAATYIRSLSAEPVQIIPNGINLEEYKAESSKLKAESTKPKENLRSSVSKLQSSELSKTILYVGRLEKRKGVNFLIDAFKLLQGTMPTTKLVIAGDGPDRIKLKAHAKSIGLENVSFLGFVSDSEKKQLFWDADLFCSPALYGESFGIVLLEAMAAGLPIVAGNNAGYSSVLKDRGQVSLVDPKDTADFAKRLELFLCDQELLKLYHTWSQDYVKQFAYKKVVDEYEALYRKVLE